MKEYLGVVLFFIVIGLLLLYLWRLQRIERSTALMQRNMNQVRQLYDEMGIRVDAVRKYRHDLQKHIRIVEHLLEESRQIHPEAEADYKELYDTMQEMGEDIRRNRTQYCENELIDAICRIKAEECEEEHLPFLIEINLGKEDLIHYDSYHITGILMNLLDNALEAEKKVECDKEKVLSLKIEKTDQSLSILVENDIPEGFIPDFKTSKKNLERHGLGLAIAREYARIYDGEISIDIDKKNNRCRVGTKLH